MKRSLLVIIALILLNTLSYAQDLKPDWYILERGCSVGVIRPGVNDYTLHMATTNNKPLDKAGVEAMINAVSFTAGSVVLIYAQHDGYYIASDMDGRNLVIKGDITKVERGTGCTVAYLKEDIKTASGTLKKATFMWVKEHKAGDAEATIQCNGNQTAKVPFNKLYDINQTTVEMGKKTKLKTAS